MIASPTKLRNGTWGAKVQARVSAGDSVTIRTKAGKTWTAQVARVVWSGKGITIVATEIRDSRHSLSREYCGYPCPVSGRRCCAANGPCHDCE